MANGQRTARAAARRIRNTQVEEAQRIAAMHAEHQERAQRRLDRVARHAETYRVAVLGESDDSAVSEPGFADDGVPADVSAEAEALLRSTHELYESMAAHEQDARLRYGPAAHARRGAGRQRDTSLGAGRRWMGERVGPPSAVKALRSPRRDDRAGHRVLDGTRGSKPLPQPAGRSPGAAPELRPRTAGGVVVNAPAQRPTNSESCHGADDRARELQREVEMLRVHLAVARREREEMQAAIAETDARWEQRLADMSATFESEIARAVAEAQRRQQYQQQYVHHAVTAKSSCSTCPRCSAEASANSSRTMAAAAPEAALADGKYWQGMYRDAMRQLGRVEGQLRDAQLRAARAEAGKSTRHHDRTRDAGVSDVEEEE